MEAQMKSQRAASRSATTTPPETEATIELQPSEKEFLDAFRRFADFMDREVEFYGEGPWHLAVAHRAIIYLLFANLKVGLLLLGWRCMALFLFGMALVKSEIMTRPAEHRPFFLKLALIGLPIGAVVQIAGLCAPWVFGLTAWTNLSREMGLYLGGIGVALGYVGCVTLLATTPRAQSWIAPLAAAGRMALTNYIGQSVICGLIFYSLGLGLIGKIEYFWVVPLTLGIYALQLVISPLWLRVFRFGPLEWIWRSLTYLQRQPMIRQRA